MKPEIITGDIFVDDRGPLSFVNSFNFNNIKRFYMVENFSINSIRAFHGHMNEEKYVFIPQGSALIICSKIEKDTLSNSNFYKFVLSSKKPSILKIPGGFANGFKPLEDNTKIIFFSSSTLDESKNDDYRFKWDVLGENIWKVENR